MIDGALAVATNAGADAIILAATLPAEQQYLERRVSNGTRVILRSGSVQDETEEGDAEVVTLPQVRLRRRGRAKVALLEALASGALRPGETVVIISGNTHDNVTALDTIAFVHLSGADTALDGEPDAPLTMLRDAADPAIFDALLTLCIELGRDGREGKPVGLTATLGDHERVLQRSHPLVINPIQGHIEDDRNILIPAARRAIREFSGMDGAFVVSREGIVVAGGRYLQDVGPETHVPTGLGARHRAAAGITASTNAISFCVSESSGDTRVFGGGRLLMTIARAD
jgi:DNA integrity scanning protein DisA with diadenylate cyclase activity